MYAGTITLYKGIRCKCVQVGLGAQQAVRIGENAAYNQSNKP